MDQPIEAKIRRTIAQNLVDQRTIRIEQYRAVRFDDARTLLGEVRFAALRRDPIRGLGPTPETFYPWNVVDQLAMADAPTVLPQ